MSTFIKLLLGLSTLVAIGAFVAAFAAHILLQFQIDHDRVKHETGEPGWKIFGSLLAPVDFYKEQARIIWKIQRFGLTSFAVSLGVIAVVMVGAVVVGISLE